MIANTQANPLSGLMAAVNPQATAFLGSNSGVAQPRFDLTLLEMTKQVIDTAATAPEKPIVPEKVQKAFESVLNTLAQQSPETQMQLGKAPDAIRFQNTLVTQAANGGNLTVPEHKQLDELVGMVVGRLQANLQQVIALPDKKVEEATRAFSVLHSGPQGGTTVPQQDSSFKAGDTVAAAPVVPVKDDRDLARQLPQLAAAVPVPMIVSARTQVEFDSKPGAVSGPSAAAATQAVSAQPAMSQNAIVLTASAPKPIEAPQASTQVTMKTDAVPQFSQNAPSETLSPEPKISPEIRFNTNNQMQDSKPVAAEEKTGDSSPKIAASQAGTQEVSAPQAQSQVAAPVAVGEAAKTLEIADPKAAQIEILSSTEALPEIVPGSEIKLNDVEPVVANQVKPQPEAAVVAQAMPKAPELAPLNPVFTASANVQPLPSPSPAQPQAAPVSSAPVEAAVQAAAAVLSPINSQEQVQTLQSPEPAENSSASPAASQPSTTLSPFSRFLDENAARLSAKESTQSVQAPVILTRESLKDLAGSITQEYGLRKNVFEQAMQAIEEAGQSQSQIRIQLKPEALGKLEVSLSMEGGKLTARLIASSNEVRDVFAANMSQFKQALEAQGLQVNQISVAVRADSGNAGQPQQQWQQAQPSWSQAVPDEAAPPAPNAWAAFQAPGYASDGNSTFNALA